MVVTNGLCNLEQQWQYVKFPSPVCFANKTYSILFLAVHQPMGFWLKSFDSIPSPVPGVTYTVSQINLRTSISFHRVTLHLLATTSRLAYHEPPSNDMANTVFLSRSSPPSYRNVCRRCSSLRMDQRWTSPWSSVASGAVITIITAACLINLLLYGHDKAHYALYYLLQLGSGGGPQILNWISELTGDDVSITVSGPFL